MFRSITINSMWVAGAMIMATAAHAQRSGGMIAIPEGTHRALYASIGEGSVVVPGFRIDRDPVTRAEFVAFVTTHPEWRRSNVVGRTPAVRAYLTEWQGDLDAGSGIDLRRPVTSISWDAANAYCESVGKRLPKTAEWEYVAAASETRRDGFKDKSFVQSLVAVYSTRQVPVPVVSTGAVNAYGVRGLHDLAWEWVEESGRKSHEHPQGHGPIHDASCAGAAIGAADPGNYPAFLRFALRSALTPQTTMQSLGFRCVS